MYSEKKKSPVDDFEYWLMHGEHSSATKSMFSFNQKKLSIDQINQAEDIIKTCSVKGRNNEVLLQFNTTDKDFVKDKISLYNSSAKSSRQIAVKHLGKSNAKQKMYITLCYKQEKTQIHKKGFWEKIQNTKLYQYLSSKLGNRRSTLSSMRSTGNFNKIIKKREANDPDSVVKLKDGSKLTVFQYSSLFAKPGSSGHEVDLSHLKDKNEIAKYNSAQLQH